MGENKSHIIVIDVSGSSSSICLSFFIIIIITTISVDATFFLLIHVFMETLNFDLVNKKKNYLKNVEKEKNVAWVLVYQTIKPVTFPRDDFVLFYANSSIHLIHSHNIINSSHNLLFAH